MKLKMPQKDRIASLEPQVGNCTCALKCSLRGQNGGQIWNQHEILYKISPDFSYIGRIVQLDWIWPPFWGQRSHTRAQELFLFSFLVVLRVWTGLQTPKSYFGAKCILKIKDFYNQRGLINHKIDWNHLPNLWLSFGNTTH